MIEKENQNVELKSRWSDENQKIVCAFANSSGRKIYIGIDDNGKIVDDVRDSIFYYAGLIESWGSGTIKMIELCKESGLPEPDFINYEQGIGAFSVIFYKDIYTEENLRKMGLNERQIKAVMYIKQKGRITNKEYREINKVSDEGARIDLNQLVDRGILILRGKGRNAHYVLK